MIKYYDIHGLIRMRIVNATKTFNRLKYFECDILDDLDIDVIIGPFSVNKKEFTHTEDDYYVAPNRIYKEYIHKISDMEYYIENLDGDKTTILFDGEPFFSVELLIMLILEPLFVYKASKKGATILHASALSMDGIGCLFTGDTGIGKTSILLKLLDNPNAEYLADDQTIVFKNILAYPVPIGFRRHLVDSNDIEVSKKNGFILDMFKAINRLFNYYSNLTLRLFPEEIVYKQSKRRVVAGTRATLKKIFILKLSSEEPHVEKTNGYAAFPEILAANNSNEDKLKLFSNIFKKYARTDDTEFWFDYNEEVYNLICRDDIDFYIVYLNKKYDYAETLEEIKRLIRE